MASNRTLIIADIGACHDGAFARMMQACDVSRDVGVDALKFQWVSDPVGMAKRRGKAWTDGYADIYERYLAWPAQWHGELADMCRQRGVEYMCTVYLPQDVGVVAPYVARFKIASFEAQDLVFVAAHQPWASVKPVIVSTGMMGPEAIDPHGWRQKVCRSLGWYPLAGLSFLDCVSAYPTPLEQLNLSNLWSTNYASDPNFDGVSDHTAPEFTWTGALAVAAGAHIVEAHLRLPSTDSANPDYAHAMIPEQFTEYVQHIRFAERCLGESGKRVQPSEQAMQAYRCAPTEANDSD